MSKLRLLLAAFALMIAVNVEIQAAPIELDGFTEPHRTINVAANETGIVTQLFVREGEFVEIGQPLAQLDHEVQQALLAIAVQKMNSKGRLAAAEAELKLRRQRFDKLESLRLDGHARQEELDRAGAEIEVAEANVRAAQEELLTRELEHRRVGIQLEKRTIRAPVAGVITTLHKQVGEFVAPNNPDLLTLVELDPLLANFTVISPHADKLQLDRKVRVFFPTLSIETSGRVELIAPTTDAESGTIRIKVRIDNSDNRFRSGERCKIYLP